MTKELSIKSNIVPTHCVWALLCSLSSIDQEKNNISLFDIIEEIHLPEKIFNKKLKKDEPIIGPFPHEMILFWTRSVNISGMHDELPFEFKVKTKDPAGKVIQENLVHTKIPMGKKRMRFRLKTNVLVITTPGDYVYEIEVRKSNSDEFVNVNNIPFEVAIVKSATK